MAANITGTPGPDTLNGTPNADTIRGRGGDDTINGRGGADDILGNVATIRSVAAAGPTTSSVVAATT